MVSLFHRATINYNILPTYPHNMVKFDPAAEILLASLDHACKFQWVSRLGSVTTALYLLVGVSQTLRR